MARFLPLHDIVITNIVWCMAYTGKVGGRSYIAQKSRNSIAVVWVLQMGWGNKGMIDAWTHKNKWKNILYTPTRFEAAYRLLPRRNRLLHRVKGLAPPPLYTHAHIHPGVSHAARPCPGKALPGLSRDLYLYLSISIYLTIYIYWSRGMYRFYIYISRDTYIIYP